jgi:hypothetical protein
MQPRTRPITLMRIARWWHELARLLKRVFDIDIERCQNCGSALKIIAAGAAAGSVPSSLIPRPDSTSFTPRADKPARPALARAAIRCRPRPPQIDAGPEKSTENCRFSPKTGAIDPD